MAGRPKANIDWNRVNQLLEAGCLHTEIAAYFNIHRDSLYERCLKDNQIDFPTYSKEKKARGESILRAKQYENAIKGNTTMQIWLGKQRLGQREQRDDNTQQQKIVFEVNYPTDNTNNSVTISPETVSTPDTTETQ